MRKLKSEQTFVNGKLVQYEYIYNKAGLLIQTIYHPSKFENAVKFAINKVVLPFLLIIFVLSLILGFGYLFPTVLGCLFGIYLYVFIPIMAFIGIIISLVGLFK